MLLKEDNFSNLNGIGIPFNEVRESVRSIKKESKAFFHEATNGFTLNNHALLERASDGVSSWNYVFWSLLFGLLIAFKLLNKSI